MLFKKTILFLVIFLFSHLPAFADVRTRYGTVIRSDVSFEGGLTATYQTSSDSRLHDELLMSVDLVANKKIGDGQLTLYVEANTSPQYNGIAAVLLEANGDAATAVDRDNRGRFQVSELHYTCTYIKRCTSYGLLDPSAFVDISNVANDETSQFLNRSFINNPTIAFPDYTLGAVLHKDYDGVTPGYTLLLSSSHGLADNPNSSYSELIDVTADGKGVFTALEFYWASGSNTLRAGGWYSSADHLTLDGSRSNENNYGLFFVMDHTTGNRTWSVRLGAANEEVSAAAYFSSFAIEQNVNSIPLGFAIAKTWLSDKVTDSNKGDRSEAELYARFIIGERFSLSPTLQVIRNSGFDRSESVFDSPVTVYSLRANYAF